MLKYHSYDIVFQEIPGEVTLAINITNCPNHCRGCHSPHLQDDVGEELTESALSGLLDTYGDAVTCVCFMGGDAAPDEVLRLAEFVRQQTNRKTAWYSGLSTYSAGNMTVFNYIKLGPYIEALGGLDSRTTNQRLYRIEEGKMVDITFQFSNTLSNIHPSF